MKKVLQKFGFTENETEVYLGFYKNPLLTGAQLARKLRMDKSSTYRALEALSERGFLIGSESKKGRVYQAASPETLNELYKEKLAKLETDKGILDQFIHDLKLENMVERATYFTIEHGLDSVKRRIVESLMCQEKTIRERWGYHKFLDDPEYMPFITQYANERVKNKIFIKQLDGDIEKMKEIFDGFLQNQQNPYKEVRVLPEDITDKNFLRIWDDTVNIVSFDEEGDFIVATIKDPFIASMMKNFYDFVFARSALAKEATLK